MAIASYPAEPDSAMMLGLFFLLTYFPFSLVCILISAVMFARRLALNKLGWFGLVPAVGLLLLVLIILVLILSGR